MAKYCKDMDKDPMLDEKLKHRQKLRYWCKYGRYVYLQNSFVSNNQKHRNDSEADETLVKYRDEVEWLVYLPNVFENFILYRLKMRLEEECSGYSVTRGNALEFTFFEDHSAIPDIIVCDTLGNTVAVYDVKLYKTGFRARQAHRLQVEAYCHVLNTNNNNGQTIFHAGLIYGYWKQPNREEASKTEKNCYHINLAEDDSKTVLQNLDEQLNATVKDFKNRL